MIQLQHCSTYKACSKLQIIVAFSAAAVAAVVVVIRLLLLPLIVSLHPCWQVLIAAEAFLKQ